MRAPRKSCHTKFRPCWLWGKQKAVGMPIRSNLINAAVPIGKVSRRASKQKSFSFDDKSVESRPRQVRAKLTFGYWAVIKWTMSGSESVGRLQLRIGPLCHSSPGGCCPVYCGCCSSSYRVHKAPIGESPEWKLQPGRNVSRIDEFVLILVWLI